MKIPSEKLCQCVSELVDKPLGSLKAPEEVDKVLRRRLTKKEYKLLIARVEQRAPEELMAKLRLDTERARLLHTRIRQKLNRDSIKRELYEAET